MLYVGCGNCGRSDPLWCAGSFMPHVPMMVVAVGSSPCCGLCGPLPPSFTCCYCGVTQLIYMPGMRLPSGVPGVIPRVAPAVQAGPGAGGQDLGRAFASVMSHFTDEFADSFGSQVGESLGAAFNQWMSW